LFRRSRKHPSSSAKPRVSPQGEKKNIDRRMHALAVRHGEDQRFMLWQDRILSGAWAVVFDGRLYIRRIEMAAGPPCTKNMLQCHESLFDRVNAKPGEIL